VAGEAAKSLLLDVRPRYASNQATVAFAGPMRSVWRQAPLARPGRLDKALVIGGDRLLRRRIDTLSLLR
jgi:hypothetical protein